jgi:hypothetical protein
MPASAAAACPPPVLRAGQDVRVWNARLAAAWKVCRDRHADAVRFYDDVRTRLR